MTLEQEALNFIDALQTEYLVTRNIDMVLPHLDMHCSWIGTGRTELCLNAEEMAAALRREKEECPQGFTVTACSYTAQAVADGGCVIYGTLSAEAADPRIAELDVRVTMVTEKTDDLWRLVHIHISSASIDQLDDELHIRRSTVTERKTLKLRMKQSAQELEERSNDLRLTLERYQTIMEQVTDILFEWDCKTDTLEFSPNWSTRFGCTPIKQDAQCSLQNSNNLHPDDKAIILKIMQDCNAGVASAEAEVRIRHVNGQYLWNRVRLNTQYNNAGVATKVIGNIVDINDEKSKKLRTLEQAQKDTLTGLYNKNAARSLVEECMSTANGNRFQALMIIDVDNFKQINSLYGHACGDTMLSAFTSVLEQKFSSSDILGRIGGDEFLAYMPEIDGERDAWAVAESVMDALRGVHPCKNDESLTCSIGIALFPQRAVEYYTLYQCADQALYQIKENGKNGFAFYDPILYEISQQAGVFHSAVSAAIDSEQECEDGLVTVGEKLAYYALRMLHHSIDVETAIARVLEIVGRAYDVSRVYIFESVANGTCCSDTFEWCNTGVAPVRDLLQNLSYADFGNYQNNFDQYGVFNCRDVTIVHQTLYKLFDDQDVCALLQCAIMDDGEFMGFVGFDECRQSRIWNQEQTDALMLLSNILSTFLLKLRYKTRLQQLPPS